MLTACSLWLLSFWFVLSIRIVFVRELEIWRGHRQSIHPSGTGYWMTGWPSTGTQHSAKCRTGTILLLQSCRCDFYVMPVCDMWYAPCRAQNTSKWHQLHKQRLRSQLKKMISWISLRRTGLFVAIPVLINMRLLADSRYVYNSISYSTYPMLI